ncbi:methyltransferase domain-containing protein [Streptomyces sp. NPDC015350]|uniref:methyltransferase domain-containing protein n=1 Tax=Streptomyces sp. NPDC015350 TaxID=3364955 RepID=UPI0036FE3D8A
MSRQFSLEKAADVAAVSALLQIGVELGADQVLDSGDTFDVADLAKATDVPVRGIEEYVTALVAAGLVVEADVPGQYRAAEDFAESKYQAGYVSWAMNANQPFLDNARAFLTDREAAARVHRRDGRRVAVSSRWMAERAVYPDIIDQVNAAGAQRVTDLGAGTGGLLIQLLLDDPAREAVALDVSPAACAAAREAADRAGVSDRLEVAERSIESLVDDAAPVEGAEAILASFAMHDVLQDEALCHAVLRRCHQALPPNGFMAVADAVSYAQSRGERQFSALFTYVHANFMDIRLPSEHKWQETFRAAGFSTVKCLPQVLPGSRLFVATKREG